MSPKRVTVLIASIAVVTVALTGCSGSKHAPPASSTPASSASSSGLIPQPAAPPAPTSLPTYRQYPVPSTVRDDPTKRQQVHIDSCASTGSDATARGTIRNSGSKRVSYDITVFFTSNTATAVNYATTTVTVGAAAAASFTAERAFAAPVAMLCVLAGVS
jgi:PBP1b-binding outer membrane lipoprotein LpoB